MRARLVLITLAVGALAVSVGGAQADSGDLDTSFGTGGAVFTDFGGSDDVPLGIAMMKDGKLVLAGRREASPTDDIALARYTKKGKIDKGFGGGDGLVVTDLGASEDQARGVAITPNHRIVAVGRTDTGGDNDFVVVQYKRNGGLDPHFGGGDGIVVTDFGANETARAVAVQPNGKIVVVGTTSTGNTDIALARYNRDGTPDTNFGTGGTTTAGGVGYDDAVGVVIQKDGKIVTAGSSSGDFGQFDLLVVRFTAGGTTDSTFDGDGFRFVNFAGSPPAFTASADAGFAVSMRADQKIVAAGTSNANGDNDFAVVRLTDTGANDPDFNGGSPVTVDIAGNGEDVANGVLARGGGNIILAGSRESGGFDYALAALLEDGSVDTNFGTNGRVQLDFGSDEGFRAVISPADLVTAVGESDSNGSEDFTVLQFKA